MVNEAMHETYQLSSCCEKRLGDLEAWQSQYPSLCDQLRLTIDRTHQANLTGAEDTLVETHKIVGQVEHKYKIQFDLMVGRIKRNNNIQSLERVLKAEG